MDKFILNSLDPTGFVKLIPNREAVIEATEACEYREHPANTLAKKLHPAVQHLKVENVENLSEDCAVYTLVSEKEGEGVAYFDAGQYLSVIFEIGGTVTTRPYSIASSPKDSLRGFYKICVKRQKGGAVSGYILDNWQAGTVVKASAPLGTFTYEPLRDEKEVIAIAGGSGITPILSLAKAVFEGSEELSLTVIYGANSEKELYFKNVLDELAKKCQNIKVVYILANEDAESCEKGYISAEIIRKYAPEKPYSLFVCGPQALYSYLEGELSALSLSRKHIRREVQGENAFLLHTAPEAVRVRVKHGGTATDIIGCKNETVLRIIEKGGIKAPSHCRSGECGFCRAKLVSGKVYMGENADRRRLADAQYGYIHPCCTYPVTDIEIEVSALD
ncbi:MAG: 2Fe-2S iron-sulfur cluster binding domain-containing protein [Clostridia bacterium]|nr:2Fe-2S iron-sulfur cluster binding domain-containing protein [Clostridia bacterium]